MAVSGTRDASVLRAAADLIELREVARKMR
jgi:hypothetical protein